MAAGLILLLRPQLPTNSEFQIKAARQPLAPIAQITALAGPAKTSVQSFPDTRQRWNDTIKAPCEAAGGTIKSLVCEIPPPAPAPAPIAPQSPQTPSGGGSNRQLGYAMAVARGWGGHWQQIDALITRESGWNNHAQNPSSTACGIGQDINGCEVGSDPGAQIQWAYNYIAGRYGSPAGAWAHSQRFGWY